jgi:hypothetical protein
MKKQILTILYIIITRLIICITDPYSTGRHTQQIALIEGSTIAFESDTMNNLFLGADGTFCQNAGIGKCGSLYGYDFTDLAEVSYTLIASQGELQ